VEGADVLNVVLTGVSTSGRLVRVAMLEAADGGAVAGSLARRDQRR
jgi:hypothetical protein